MTKAEILNTLRKRMYAHYCAMHLCGQQGNVDGMAEQMAAIEGIHFCGIELLGDRDEMDNAKDEARKASHAWLEMEG